jgi:cleavage and polyadenylation specificity factor subunit 3
VSNPFVFKHVLNLKGMDQFDDSGPCVVMASPGMLQVSSFFSSATPCTPARLALLLIWCALSCRQNGLSRELFELWCPDKKNGTVIPGYCVESVLLFAVHSFQPRFARSTHSLVYLCRGTLAKHIMSEPTHITTMSGAKVPMHASVAYGLVSPQQPTNSSLTPCPRAYSLFAVSFSAHADFSETSEFVDLLKPPHVVCVQRSLARTCCCYLSLFID